MTILKSWTDRNFRQTGLALRPLTACDRHSPRPVIDRAILQVCSHNHSDRHVAPANQTSLAEPCDLPALHHHDVPTKPTHPPTATISPPDANPHLPMSRSHASRGFPDVRHWWLPVFELTRAVNRWPFPGRVGVDSARVPPKTPIKELSVHKRVALFALRYASCHDP